MVPCKKELLLLTSFHQHRHAGAKNKGNPKWRPTIRSYLIMMNVILLCLLFPSISVFFLNQQAEFHDAQLERTIKQMRASLESRGASLVRSMALSAGHAVAGYDFTFLNVMVDQVVTNDPEIIYCIIMDADRKAMIHSDKERAGGALDGDLDLRAASMQKTEFPSAP